LASGMTFASSASPLLMTSTPTFIAILEYSPALAELPLSG